MADKYAYRASDTLVAALRAYERDVTHWYDTVMKPWDDAHPDTRSVWTRNRLDVEVLGFTDPCGDKPPPGLSRAKGRDWLIPRNSRTGKPWLDAMMTLDRRPKLSAVFAEFGVETTILRVDHSRMYWMGMVTTPDAIYLTWGVEYPKCNAHLTPVKLSEFYAAWEALEESKTAPEAEQ